MAVSKTANGALDDNAKIRGVSRNDITHSESHNGGIGCSNGTQEHVLGPEIELSQDGDPSSAIAIIGVSGRFPGDGTTPRNLWDIVKEGRNALSDVPESRFNVNGFYHPDGGRPGTFNTKQGYFLKHDVDRFDASFFSITPEEAKGMDPTQRILLELAHEGLENGACQHDYWDLQAYDLDSAPKYTATGTGPALLSNRISWFFNLKGPSITIDTACSSSLTALHLASQSIRHGESDSALVGGLGLHLLPNYGVFMSSMSFLSADNKCHSFDASANGYARAEGGGFVVLKRLDKALMDGDTIRAVIRGTGVNQDGRTPGITQPSASRQEELIRETYNSAGLSLDKTSLFEAHGTGTKLGDPIECSVIGSVFGSIRRDPVYVGSVKSNIGHLEGASGLAGLIKTVYSLESGIIAPTHGLENINPKIKLDDWNISIPTSAISWPAGLRRASINSFGYGGANAHAVLDDAYHFLAAHTLQGHHNTKIDTAPIDVLGSNGSQIQEKPTTNKIPRLFILSSHEESGIQRVAHSLQAYLAETITQHQSEGDFLHRLAYTLSEKRSRFPWKTCAVASTISELRNALGSGGSTKPTRAHKPQALTFIFTGQGAQWFAMGRSLQNYPVFQKSLLASCKYLKAFGTTWDLIEELNRSADDSRIDLPAISQPACTALQLGIIDLLASWNIRPQVVMGHSSGEIAAAYAKGAFDKETAMRIAYFRGVLTNNITKTGSMAAVGIGPEAVHEYLDRVTAGKIAIACINSPSNVTLSGDVEGIDEIVKLLQDDNIFARKLRVTTAYHSHHMQQIAEAYLASLTNNWKPRPGFSDLRMFSSVSAKPVDGTELGPSYWVANLVSPVNFSGAVTAAAQAGALGKRKSSGKKGSADVTVEIGPHAALQGPLKQILDSLPKESASPRYFSAIKRKQDAIHTMLEMVGELVVLGHPVDVTSANAYADAEGGISALIDLPPYAWNTSYRYWQESAAVSAYKQRSHPRLELLGAKDTRSTTTEPAWHNYLRIAEQPWIEHHQFQNTNIYPMAGMIVMAIEATRQIETRTDVSGYHFRDVNIGSALVVPLDHTVETRVQLSPWRSGTKSTSSSWTNFTVSSRSESGSWTTNCTGLISTSYDREGMSTTFEDEEAASNSQLKHVYEEILQTDLPVHDPAVFYSKLDESGFKLGPAFCGVRKLNLYRDLSHFSMEVLDTNDFYPSQWEPDHLIHPAVLDVFVHLLLSSTGDGSEVKARVPVSTASLYVSAKFDSTAGTKYHGFSTSKKQGPSNMLSDVIAFGEDGTKPLVALRGCKTVPLLGTSSQSSSSRGKSFDHIPLIPYLAPDVDFHEGTQLEQLLQGTDLATKLGRYITLLGHKHPSPSILAYSQSSANILASALISLENEDSVVEHVQSIVLASPFDSPDDEDLPFPDTWKNKIQYQTLDLSQELSSQGLDEDSMDIALFDTTINYEGEHVSPFKNLKSLLKPHGILVITAGVEGSATNPNHSIATAALNSTGFTVTEIHVPNASGFLIAQKVPELVSLVRKALIVMPEHFSNRLGLFVEQLYIGLSARGYDVIKAELGSIPEHDSTYLTLSVLDIDSPILESPDEHTFSKLRDLILGSSGILWLTAGKVSGGLSKGLGRTIRAEHPETPFATLDINPPDALDTEANIKAICSIFEGMSKRSLGEAADSEYVVDAGNILIERLIPDPHLKDLLGSSKSGNRLPAVKLPLKDTKQTLQLSIREPGLLDTLEYLTMSELSEPLGDNQIEIEVGSVGLNSRDISVAMGQMEDDTLGIECAGVVSRVGDRVQKFKIGDRVFGMHAGCFRTRVRVDPRTFQKTPDQLSDEEAASFMCVGATAVHSLIDVGRLQRGESVLIHSAAGGVGQVAIRLAQHLGAEIFATVSSEKKKRILIDDYGVQESHIFNSRDHSFADGILRLTDQKGVDVVLNSLTGEALRKTWLCVAPFGRFIELGKCDIYENSGLEMRPFLDNITFSGLDILTQVVNYPDRFEKIGSQVVELLKKGAIAPLNSLLRYAFGEAEKAFRLMESGGHIGKLVLYPRSDDILPDGTYILVGGLGGIGRSIAKLLTDNGAKSLVFLSRSGTSHPEAQSFLDVLQTRGVKATTIAVDVAEKSQLQAAINQIGQSCPPIKGMIHCAMDLRDGVYAKMSARDWNLSLRPKLLATRNLHELLPADLDFFVCLSSISGIIGSRGQANYNAGNTYQDALAHHRAASGLAATSINLSLVVGIGVSTERSNVFQMLKNGGLLGMDEADVLNAVKAAISGRTPTQFAIGASTGGQLEKMDANDPYWFSDLRFAALSKLDRQSSGAGASSEARDWKKLLAACSSKEAVYDLILGQLLEGVSSIIKTEVDDLDTAKSLPALGIDSLVAIEIRTWLQREFQADLSIFDIISSDPLTRFAKKVINKSKLVSSGFA